MQIRNFGYKSEIRSAEPETMPKYECPTDKKQMALSLP
jgi:hypothetical protein